MWARAGPGPSSGSPKQWKSDGRVKTYNSVRARSPLTKSKEKKLLRAQQYKRVAFLMMACNIVIDTFSSQSVFSTCCVACRGRRGAQKPAWRAAAGVQPAPCEEQRLPSCRPLRRLAIVPASSWPGQGCDQSSSLSSKKNSTQEAQTKSSKLSPAIIDDDYVPIFNFDELSIVLHMTFCPERARAEQARRGGPRREQSRVDADLRRQGPRYSVPAAFGQQGHNFRPARGARSLAWAVRVRRPGPMGCA